MLNNDITESNEIKNEALEIIKLARSVDGSCTLQTNFADSLRAVEIALAFQRLERIENLLVMINENLSYLR